ncbi:hypothetical protein [Streptomyces sp. TRM68416]|uniref:hypothetical protein n=1 Tax=Streptomyces sp. TRM68416 TaxID=2758412 RepID=UPI001661E812|nr:hypothetical protein [Streptomyces sp. TRM68416]MBD0837744.1 hypothetical protein [Streptomyces sp. TRM68416]
MGCDIHGYVEVRSWFDDTSEPEEEDSDLRWHPALPLPFLYNGRSYEAFGCLFGVRGRTFEPLAPERGFPPDASRAAARAWEEEKADSHSPSWITWAELEAADWNEREAPSRLPRDPLTRREAVRDADWGDVWTLMRILARRHGADHVRLVVWFDN